MIRVSVSSRLESKWLKVIMSIRLESQNLSLSPLTHSHWLRNNGSAETQLIGKEIMMLDPSQIDEATIWIYGACLVGILIVIYVMKIDM